MYMEMLFLLLNQLLVFK